VPFNAGLCSHYMARSSSASPEPPDWESTDPWRVLGISRGLLQQQPDAKEVKRVYKRLAMKYHPDVVTTKDSTADEKKRASDRFARINWAYSTITSQKSQTNGSSTSTGSRTGTTTNGWEPPHRRTGAYSNPSSSSSRRADSDFGSTDWRDYMPNNSGKDEVYDAGGDSFGQIFSDFVKGAASTVGAAGVSGATNPGGIFKDFVDFLEQNVDAYSTGSSNNNDADLQFLLQTGTVDEIGDEMDETELVVQQLSNKLNNVQNELIQVQADLAVASGSSYLEKLQQQECQDELQAQKTVVEGYLKRARTRLVALQTRYKDLIVSGRQNDSRVGSGGTRTSSNSSNSNGNGRPQESPRQTRSSSTPSSSTASAEPRSSSPSGSSSDSWKEEGFGSFGRGRSGSSSRSRSSRPRSYDQQPSSTPPPPSSAPFDRKAAAAAAADREVARTSQARATARTSSTSNDSNVPPHRRSSTSSYSDKMESERRLREIKVDEEFDKLKRDLGL
jgi:predicted DNA-binding protein (UPF0251 family)